MTDLDAVLRRWRVVADRPPPRTASSTLVFGAVNATPVVVKVAAEEEERRGSRLLAAWAGHGAVPVLATEGDAVLLERLDGPRDLVAMSEDGRDDEAAAVLASTAVRLHGAPAPGPEVGLLPLRTWFRDLLDHEHQDPLLRRSATVARHLLASTRAADVVALHGDLHHGNVLDAGAEWLAIDPKGLVGHRAFDHANALVNPDERAASLLARRLPVVARIAGLDEGVLRDWTLAWCGLSLVWHGDERSWHARSVRAVGEALLSGR